MTDRALNDNASLRPAKLLLLAAGVAGAGALTYYLLTRTRRARAESHAADLTITAANNTTTTSAGVEASTREEAVPEDKIVGPVRTLTARDVPPHLQETVNHLAMINGLRVAAAQEGNVQVVEVLLRKEVDLYLEALGGFDLDALDSLVILGSSLAMQGKFTEALAAKQRAMRLALKLYGADHLYTLELAQTVAEVLWHSGPIGARMVLDGFVQLHLRKEGADCLHLSKLYLSQAILHLLDGEMPAAQKTIAAARAIVDQYPGNVTADALRVVSLIRSCQYELIRDRAANERDVYATAEQHIQEAQRALERGLLQGDVVAYGVLHMRYCLLIAGGRTAEARELLPRLSKTVNHAGPLLSHSRMLRSVLARFDVVEDDPAVAAVFTVGLVVQRLSPASWESILGGRREGVLHLRTTLHTLDDVPVHLNLNGGVHESEVRTDLPDGARMHTISLPIPTGTPLQKAKYNIVIAVHNAAESQAPAAVHSQLVMCCKELSSSLESELS